MLSFAYIEESQKGLPLPKPKVNGGLYTGEPATGPWASIYIRPQVEDMIAAQSTSAPLAKAILPGSQRIGNNEQTNPDCVYYPNTRLLCK